MRSFNYFQPTEIVFGTGRLKEIGAIARKFGTRCLLVTGKKSGAAAPLYDRTKRYLQDECMTFFHFDGVVPNPTTDVVSAGAKMAKEINAEVVIGLGGGSAMDTAKAIAVEASHEGTAWDYLFYKKQPTEKTLPIIVVSTTSGTGSQTTQCAVITKTEDKDKSAIWNPNIYPRVAIVDPECVRTLPPGITAATGFDAFAHAFEGYLSVGASPYTEMLSLKAMALIIRNLATAVNDGTDMAAREAMALADTLSGSVITNAGVTLPHGLGMQISGHCPHVAHGVSLAVIYPEFTKFTWQSSVKKFATVGRMFNPDFLGVSDEQAAWAACEEINYFLRRIGLWVGFKDIGVSKEALREIADCGQVLSDYRNNPRIASIGEMYDMLINSFER